MRALPVIALTLTAQMAVGDVALQFPVDCTLGDTCHIQHLVDHDPSAGTRDYACGSLTYDGHKGTDFALPSLNAQRAGVTVFAVADGKVMGVRDEMVDIMQGHPDAPDVSNRECGNGVVIKHADNIESQYCHLAQGSVLVSAGEVVTAGTPLGKIGLSGKTQFPHLHLSLRKNGRVADPFDMVDAQTCDDPLDDIWTDPLPVQAGGIVSIGTSDHVPNYPMVKQGDADMALHADSPALVGWAFVYMAQRGDQLHTRITGPQGQVVDHTEVLTRPQAQLFRATGRRTPAGGWTKGDYLMDIRLLRDGVTIDTGTKAFRLD